MLDYFYFSYIVLCFWQIKFVVVVVVVSNISLIRRNVSRPEGGAEIASMEN